MSVSGAAAGRSAAIDLQLTMGTIVPNWSETSSGSASEKELRQLVDELTHLTRNEECVTRFCHFLTTMFGAPLRLDGLTWLAAMLKERAPSGRWYRGDTTDALVDLVATTLGSDALVLSQNAQARQALIEIAAVLAAMNIPAALALQERIKQLR
ncbi:MULTISPECIES: hypothetical protein [unclassified Pseudomonas]|uniref:hypothetical protein n=1 Tax=unclassified Pseudomonas TaxID=196821 RepID=UPI0015ABBD74|nr:MULTISPECIES: hypothetical protein [unclassified Pseudomonas]MCU1737988.1 hypothetical protein [Pseudomonas sp. 20S_6.2_Bac1]